MPPHSGHQDFHQLMRHRIMDILLVASPYDAFILEADGQLSELVLSETLDATPAITSVASGREALRLLAGGRRFDLVVATLHVGDVNAVEIGRTLLEKDPHAPLVILASDARELAEFLARHGAAGVWQTFVWQGDVRLLSAIVRCVEDRKNVAHDAIEKGVQVILLVEDSVRYASSFLPAIYDELLEQSHRLLPEGINVAHKLARLRARPKILLCRTFEEAWDDFLAYEAEILGVISDVEFPRARAWSATAGIELARDVRTAAPDVPIVLQSSRPENDALARAAGAAFLLKGSPTLLGFNIFCCTAATYDWYVVNGSTRTRIDGTDALLEARPMQTTTYIAVATNDCGSISSAPAP